MLTLYTTDTLLLDSWGEGIHIFHWYGNEAINILVNTFYVAVCYLHVMSLA